MLYEIGFTYDDFSDGGWQQVYLTTDPKEARRVRNELQEKYERTLLKFAGKLEIREFPLDEELDW